MYKVIIFVIVCISFTSAFVLPTFDEYLNIEKPVVFRIHRLPSINYDDENGRIILPLKKVETHEALERYRRQTQSSSNNSHNQHGSISVGAEKNRFGTNLQAEAQARIWQSPNRQSSLDANAFYQQQFGRHSSNRPNYGGGLSFSHRF